MKISALVTLARGVWDAWESWPGQAPRAAKVTWTQVAAHAGIAC